MRTTINVPKNSKTISSSNDKWCFVPECNNTTILTPDKIFINLKKKRSTRIAWFKAAQRQLDVPFSSPLYCCEDHFNKKEDIENLIQYQLMDKKVKLKLKPGVIPHIFECQRGRKRAALDQQKPCAPKNFNKRDDTNHSDASTQTWDLENMGVYPEELNVTVTTLPIKIGAMLCEIEAVNHESDSDFIINTIKEEPLLEDDFQVDSVVKEHCEMYLGIPNKWYYILKEVDLPQINVHLVLMKIRLDDSFERLGHQFGVSAARACQIFKETIYILSHYFKDFICWPSKEKIKKVPSALRGIFYNTQSIIDCIEIEIEKPSNLIHQCLTWSDCKNCNTVKYLISTTPDGLINFVSEGYGGHTKDCALLGDSNFLQKLPQGCSVMANRGFMDISTLLSNYGCTVTKPETPIKNEIVKTEGTADVHSKIEEVIGKLRKFALLKQRAVIDLIMLHYIDDIMIVVCGLINLQNLSMMEV